MQVLKFLMFNRITKHYLNSDLWFLRLNKRVKSLTLEMWYTMAMFFPFIAILMFIKIGSGKSSSAGLTWIELLTLIPFTLMLVALFNKDFFGGQSVVHRKIGYKVIDAKTNETASKLQCPIWPIEAIFIFVSPTRRLGDWIAGTILINVPPSDPELILPEIRTSKLDRQTILTLILSVIFVALFTVSFDPRVRLWILNNLITHV